MRADYRLSRCERIFLTRAETEEQSSSSSTEGCEDDSSEDEKEEHKQAAAPRQGFMLESFGNIDLTDGDWFTWQISEMWPDQADVEDLDRQE